MSVFDQLDRNEFESFAAYIHALVDEQLMSDQPTRPFEEGKDGTFFRALNDYLSSEGQPQFDSEVLSDLPVSFTETLTKGMDFYTLSKCENVYNSGEDMKGRITTPSRNAALGNFHDALATYYKALGLEVKVSKYQNYAADAIPEEYQHPTLFKLRIDKDEQGVMKRRLDPVDAFTRQNTENHRR